MALFFIFRLHQIVKRSVSIIRRQRNVNASRGTTKTVTNSFRKLCAHTESFKELRYIAASTSTPTSCFAENSRVGKDRGKLGFQGFGARTY
nr:unnamed protein product [Callosobruchus chinensis]